MIQFACTYLNGRRHKNNEQFLYWQLFIRIKKQIQSDFDVWLNSYWNVWNEQSQDEVTEKKRDTHTKNMDDITCDERSDFCNIVQGTHRTQQSMLFIYYIVSIE